MPDLLLAIDQGTTSTRAILFDAALAPVATAQIPLAQHFPQPGWVEHDADEIWRAVVQVCREVIDQVGGPHRVAAIGLTNQRETTVAWDKPSGRPLHRAIVWQDRRTAEHCARLKPHEAYVQAQTGLLLDPYFSATKMAWLLDHIPSARPRAEAGELALGTVDSFLLHRLTGGRVHATDPTNASRTSLYRLTPPGWSQELCALFEAPPAALPEVRPSAGPFGETDPALFGRAIPITGVAGDQQAALIGHGCCSKGGAKATFGTGCFVLAHTGASPRASRHRLLATLAYEAPEGIAYALEGSIFSAGATVQWLRDGLGLITASRESEALAAALPDNGGVYLVPAFTGLGAPQWAAAARGVIVGLTRDSSAAHLVRAGLEAVAYQTADLLEAFAADGAGVAEALRVDGGMTANAWFLQFLADICARPIERPAFQELTALGAARLAMVGAGLARNLSETPGSSLAPARFEPQMPPGDRERLLAGWNRAVAATLTHAGDS